MTLEAAVSLTRGAFTLDVALTVADGETVAVLGPNGAGKSTLLAALAGLLPIDAGRITLDGAVLDDPAAGRFVAPARRPVGVVFQDGALFGHLTALGNVAFGLRRHGQPRRAAEATAREWLDRVGLGDHADARPAELSGGQAQRVALARALVLAPRLLLLDEPLAALDVRTRSATRRELSRQLAGFDGARVLVTHDPLEAAALADRLVVVEDGRVVQSGTPEQVRAVPRSAYVAELAGQNLLRGTAEPGGVRLRGGLWLATAGDEAPPPGEALAVVSPRAVALFVAEPSRGSPRNVIRGHVDDVEPTTDGVRVRLAGPVPLVALLSAAAAAELALAPGDEVWAQIKAAEIAVHAV